MPIAKHLLVSVPATLDEKFSPVAIAVCLAVLLGLVMFPTGVLDGNEEFYFQTARMFWEKEPLGLFSAIQEKSEYLFLSAVLIGLPTKFLGFEAANAILRLITAAALAIGFARLAAAWRMSALDTVLAIAVFVLMGQEFFGGEWIFQFVEGKVFAYACVFFGLAHAFNGKWIGCVVAFVAATYFHFLVGGFWMLVALIWMLLPGDQWKQVARAAIAYSLAVLPLVSLILWHRINGASPDSSVDTWHIYAVIRMPHHIAPFSNHNLIWSWTPGIVYLFGTLLASIMSLELELSAKVKRLIKLLIGLQLFLLVGLVVSAFDAGVRAVGQFYVFRPSSMILLLVIVAAVVAYRELGGPRLPVWIASWVLVPAVCWGAVMIKAEEVLVTDVEPEEVEAMIAAATLATDASEIVLIQPGRDGLQPEVKLERLMNRPTLVNWRFVPTVPANIAIWYEKEQFREQLFTNGCVTASQFPVGALIIRNDSLRFKILADTCGTVIWRGATYSVLDIS